MRVLFFNYEYPPLGGGAGNATAYLLREYSKIPGLKLDLVTSSIDDDHHVDSIGDNIRIYRLPIGKNKKNLHFQSQKDLLVYFYKAYLFSRKIVQQEKYDLTHSFFTVPCGYISWSIRKSFGIPYIVSLRGADVPGYSERFTLIYKILTPLVKAVWRSAAFVVANSRGLKELALKTAKKQDIQLIYNGVNTDEFEPEYLVGDKFKIICVSRITPRKGIAYLIEAIKYLKEKGHDLELKIIGEGNEKGSLKKMVIEYGLDKEVELLGLLQHDELPEYYKRANAFVLPSLNEGMSNTMLEALASGLPIISTDTGGSEELVEDGKNGYIVKMKSSKDIAEKIALLIKDKEKCLAMSELSRKKAESMSWENVANAYFKIYKEAMLQKK